jgi:hypothetical protein
MHFKEFTKKIQIKKLKNYSCIKIENVWDNSCQPIMIKYFDLQKKNFHNSKIQVWMGPWKIPH